MLKFALLAGVSAATMLLALPARAAEASTSTDTGAATLTEVVVTATRREAPLQQVPVSVAVIKGDDLERTGDFNFADAGFTTGNFVTGLSGDNPLIGGVNIRGISGEASVYVDDVLVGSTQAYNSTLVDVDRIEILRGPQGTTFGANTIAGAVNTITKLPSFSPTGFVAVDFGEYGYRNYRGAVSGPIVDGVLAGKISLFDRSSDGYDRDPTTGTRYNGDNEWGGRAGLLYKAKPNLRFLLSADYAFLDARNTFVPTLYSAPYPGSVVGGFIAAGLLPNLSNPYGEEVFGTTGPNTIKRINTGASLRTDWDVSGLKLTNIFAFRSVSSFTHKDEDYLPTYYAYSDSPYYQHQWTDELRVSGQWNRVEWLGGFFYLNSSSTSKSVIPLSGAYLNLVGLTPGLFAELGLPESYSTDGAVYEDQDNITKTESEAVFGSANIAITSKLKLTLGGRYTHETVGGQSGALASNLPAPYLAFLPAFDYGTNSAPGSIPFYTFPNVTTNRFDPAGALTYAITSDINAYVSAGTGYHSPGFNSVANCQTTPANPFAPCIVKAETALNYEGGLKTEWFGHRLRINLVGYHLKLSNAQLSQAIPGTSGGPFVYDTVNADETSEGVELDAIARPIAPLTLEGSFGYQHAVYDHYPGATFLNNAGEASPPHCYAGQTFPAQGYCYGDATGDTLPFSPQLSGSVAATYEGHITPKIDYFLRVQDEFRSHQANGLGDLSVNEVGALNVVNLAVGVSQPVHGLAITFRVRNVGNARFITNAAVTSTGETYVNISAPRFWSVELSYKY
jgi:iron complex outermembrane receptor protein